MESAQFPHIRELSMQLIDGPHRRLIIIERSPFLIGRSPQNDLMLPQSSVSPSHAQILVDGMKVILEDTGSSHGTFVNGERITRRILQPRDAIHFGSLDGPELRWDDEDSPISTSFTILANMQAQMRSQLQGLQKQTSDLEKLRWFLDIARNLNNAAGVDRVLASLLESTLALTAAERGYVFLADGEGVLELALGMDASGTILKTAPPLSRTVMRQAINGTEQFLVTDTLRAQSRRAGDALPQNIRKIICIPFRRSRPAGHRSEAKDQLTQIFGVLYLESSVHPEPSSTMDEELLRTIAREATALVDNAQLAVMEAQARQHREELRIAAEIQQGMLSVQIPTFSFAGVQARSIPCSAVGGDFFDVVPDQGMLNVALVDVSGKGLSAAIHAAALQGMLYVQLQARQPLQAIASATNRYLCRKSLGKYASMLLLRLHEDGTLEYLNCGHIQPRLCCNHSISRLEIANLPVGLRRSAEYSTGITKLSPGDRVFLASDGFTEAEDPHGDFFGEARLDATALCMELGPMFQKMMDFCAGKPADDDCTVVQIHYSGSGNAAGSA
ncbi:MAG: SpoIIE family protein phosphatase [Acidobacteriaceae bacterium]